MNFIVFPGQASQYPGMGKDWYDNFEKAKLSFEEASDHCSLNLKKLCFEGSDSELKATEITQPAILTTCIAIWRSLSELTDVEKLTQNSIFAGHSLGEYTALVAAGSIELGEAASFVRKRGAAMQVAVPEGQGGMLALLFKPRTEETIKYAQEICEKASQKSDSNVWLANINAAEQIVVAGTTKAIKTAQIIASEGDYKVRQAVPLEVSAPFHSPLMEAAAKNLETVLENTKIVDQEKRYISNVDANVYKLDANTDEIKTRLYNQICSPVLWWQSVQKAIELGCENSIEIGPKKVLSSLARRIEFKGQKLKTMNIDQREDFKNVESILGS